MTTSVGTSGPGESPGGDEFLEADETCCADAPEEPRSSSADKRIGIATAVLLALVALTLEQVAFDKQEIGLGVGTHPIYNAQVAGEPVRNNEIPLLDFFALLPGEKQLTVWIGNSHLHAINAYQPGDRLSSTLLHLQFNGEQVPGDRPVFGLSLPNLRYEEQALITIALALQPPEHRPSLIVHGVRFHDARERGIRVDARPLLRLPEVQEAIAALDPRFGGARAALEAGLQFAMEEVSKEEGLEPWLVQKLGQWLPIFRKRDFIYARTRNRIENFRNLVFRIETTTKRPILSSRYQASMNALELAVAFAEERGVEVLLYNCPLRAAVETPYVAEQYESFRRELTLLVESNGGTYKDYDPLVPAELWGDWYDTDFPDFSHFTGAGHAVLANQVGKDIEGLLGEPSPGPEQEVNDAVQ